MLPDTILWLLYKPYKILHASDKWYKLEMKARKSVLPAKEIFDMFSPVGLWHASKDEYAGFWQVLDSNYAIHIRELNKTGICR